MTANLIEIKRVIMMTMVDTEIIVLHDFMDLQKPSTVLLCNNDFSIGTNIQTFKIPQIPEIKKIDTTGTIQ